MAEADPARPMSASQPARADLPLRILSSVVLAPLALGVAYLGGWIFVAFWGFAAFGVLWEWVSLVSETDRRAVLMTGGASVLLAVALTGGVAVGDDDLRSARLLAAVIVLSMGTIGVAALAPKRRRGWIVGGIPYAGAVGVAPVLLRADADLGFLAILFLFAIVWATDIAAYFVGRGLGGPKLVPAISPNKTWSGAIGGVFAAAAAATVFATSAALSIVVALAVVAIVLSVVAQAGDAFESALKRRFGAKDSGHLIPGHGGLMDRLDGFMAAAFLAALIGLVRGGIEMAAGGLLLW